MRRRGVWGRGGTREEADELKAQEEPEAPADGLGALHSLRLPFSIWSETSPELSKSRPEAGRAPSWAGEGQQGRRGAGGGGGPRAVLSSALHAVSLGQRAGPWPRPVRWPATPGPRAGRQGRLEPSHRAPRPRVGLVPLTNSNEKRKRGRERCLSIQRHARKSC